MNRESRSDTRLSLVRLLEQDVVADPYPLYRQLQSEDPVHWDPFLHAWVVTRYPDVIKVLHTFSASRTPNAEKFIAMGLAPDNPIGKTLIKQMLYMDAPDHTRLRGLAAAAFTPRRVEVLRDFIQKIVDDLLDRVQARGQMDIMADFADPMPAMVTAEMIGVPVEDSLRLKKLSADFAEILGNFHHDPDRIPEILDSTSKLTEYFQAAIAEARQRPREGLINSFLTAGDGGDRLSDEDIVANCILTMIGGLETTTNLIGIGLLTLTRNPGKLARLRDDPSLIPTAVEELLRFESPVQHTGRIAPEDVEMGGKQIRKGQSVMAVIAAANRDPERFPDPDELILDRQDNKHLAFGWASHFCFGAPLARMKVQIAFKTLLRRLPNLKVTPGPLTWRSNHGLRGLDALPVTFDAPGME